MRSAVSSLTRGRVSGCSARDTVAADTPTMRATSRRVTWLRVIGPTVLQTFSTCTSAKWGKRERAQREDPGRLGGCRANGLRDGQAAAGGRVRRGGLEPYAVQGGAPDQAGRDARGCARGPRAVRRRVHDGR